MKRRPRTKRLGRPKLYAEAQKSTGVSIDPLPVELVRWFDDYADKLKPSASRSAVMRQALQEFRDRHK